MELESFEPRSKLLLNFDRNDFANFMHVVPESMFHYPYSKNNFGKHMCFTVRSNSKVFDCLKYLKAVVKSLRQLHLGSLSPSLSVV